MAIRIKTKVQELLKEHKGMWPKIADATKIPLNSLIKIGRPVWKNPSVDHIETLYNYLVEDRYNAGGFEELINAGKAS